VTTADASIRSRPRRLTVRRLLARYGWTAGVYVLLAVMVAYWTRVPAAGFSSFDLQSLVIDAMPLALVAMGQSVIVVSGGIDLSVGSLMSVTNVLSAKWMIDMSSGEAYGFAVAILLLAIAMGAFTGAIVVVTRVPDIIVTLAMLFVWAGLALVILKVPGGGAPLGYLKLGTGYTMSEWIPTGAAVLAVVALIVGTLMSRTRLGLSIYAVGSSRPRAYLSGVSVARTRILAYAIGGGLAGLAGLTLTATSGIGDPLSGTTYTLNSVAAVVLGGVSLLGGVGGILGPIAAAFILVLLKTLMILKGVDQNWAQVIQGTVIILVVMAGGLLLRQKGKSGT
jgi:ribose transport system permease protein